MQFERQPETNRTITTFAEYRQVVEAFSQYQESANPDLVIRSGIIEETCEIIDAHSQREELQKEVGDAVYYLNAAATLAGKRLDEITATNSFAALQRHAVMARPVLPIVMNGEAHDRLEPQLDLTVRMLRIVDVMNPKTDALWAGCEGRLDVSGAVYDALLSVCHFAAAHGFSVEGAVNQAVQKVIGRERNPHVIDKADSLIVSNRERLTERQRAVAQLLARTIRNNR